MAAALMRRHHVGALLVTDDEPNSDRAIGIITDRDLVVQVIADGISPEKRTIGEVMTPGISTISETSDVHEAIEVMRSDGIRRLAVADEDGTLLGDCHSMTKSMPSPSSFRASPILSAVNGKTRLTDAVFLLHSPGIDAGDACPRIS